MWFFTHILSSPEPKAQVSYCHSAPSVVRPSVVVRKLSHFRLLLWNRWTEFNDTWQEARSQRPLPSLCFSGRSEKQDGRPGLWLAETFSTSPLKLLNGIQRNLTGSKISTPSTKFVFFGPIGKTRWPPWPLIGLDIFDFSSETPERNSTKLDRKQDLKALYQVCVFRADQKNKMAALASDWLRHFRLLLWNCWTEFNETWQEARSQRPLPSLCFSGRLEKQDGRPGLWLAETFSTSPLKPLYWIQRNVIGSKISTPLPSLCFLGRSEKQDGRPGLWLAETFSDFSSETAEQNSKKLDRKQDLKALYQVCVFRADRKNKIAALASDWLRHFRLLLWNPLNGIQRNLTGSKISKPSTKFVFFGPIGKTRWPPWPLIGWDIFNFSSETAERNSTKLDRKQDLNALYQVCVFRADRKNKMAALASDWLRHFRLLLWNPRTEFNETWQEARSQSPLPSLCFFGPIRKTRWPPWPLIGWDIFDFSSETAERNSTKLDMKQDLNALYQVCVFRADWKNKMAALASDWLRHFRLLLWNRCTEFNETW